jgi:5'-AMP-activated protein kinase catalytic alpha subunit
MTSSIPGNTGMIAQHQHGRRTRRWYLGIQSKKDPAHVMTEVYKALMALGCEWLQLSSYRIKCKWRPNVMGHEAVGPGGGFAVPTAGGDSPAAAWSKPSSSPPKRQGDAMDVEVDAKEINPGGGSGGAVTESTGEDMTVFSSEEGESIPIPNLSTKDYAIKIGLTLYKVQQNIYLLDFQKMTGDAFSFMTLCANIITELKTLSAASKQQALMAQQQQQQPAAISQPQMMQQPGRYPPPAPGALPPR